MGFFKKDNSTVITQESYTDRLNNVKSIFKSAYDKASVIMQDMQNDIEAKKAQVAVINEQIKDISATQAETSKFISSLEKFI